MILGGSEVSFCGKQRYQCIYAVLLITFCNLSTSLFADEAASEPPTTAATSVPSVETVAAPNTPVTFNVGVFGGMLNLKSDKMREVDKKGTTFGLELGTKWNCDSFFVGGGLGFVNASLKGSSDMTLGDQTAIVSSPFADIMLGYKITPMVAASLGAQMWFAKGSDFAPDDIHTTNRTFAYLNIGILPEATEPFSFNLRYIRDLNVQDRVISGFTLGVDYQLPF